MGGAIIGHPRFSTGRDRSTGRGRYKREIKSKIDEEENKGKVLVIDIETGQYEIDEDSPRPPDRRGRDA